MHIHIHLHDERLPARFDDRIDELKQQADKNKTEILTTMSSNEKAIIDAFDAESNRIAAVLESLKKEDDDEFNAALQVEIDKLKGLGANGTVPPPQPQP